MIKSESVVLVHSKKYDRILKSFGIETISKTEYEEGEEIYNNNFHDFVEWVEEIELEDLGGMTFTDGIRRHFQLDHDLLDTNPDAYYEALELYTAHLEVSLYRVLKTSGKVEEFEKNAYTAKLP